MFSQLRYVFKIAFFVTIGLYVSVWLFSPWFANYYLDQYLETQGLSLDNKTHIQYNPFRSRLEINTLQVNNVAGEKVFLLSFFSVELDLHQSIFEDVYIPRIVIKGLDLTIKKLQDDLLLGGISLAKFSNINQSKIKNNLSENINSRFFNRLVMSELVLTESNIDFYINKNRHQLKLHNIKIIDFFATTQKQTFELSMIGELNDGPIDINLTADLVNQEGDVDFYTKFSNIDVEKFSNFLPKNIDTLLGVLSYEGLHSLNIEKDYIALNVAKGRFSGIDVNYEKDDVHVSIEQQEINIDGFTVTLGKNKKPKIEGDGSILVRNIIIYNKEKVLILGAIKQLTVTSFILFNNNQGVKKLHIDQVDLVDSFFSDNQDDVTPALVEFTLLKIQDIDLSQYGIEIGAISLAGLVANTEFDENMKLKNLLAIPNSKSIQTLTKNTVENYQATENKVSKNSFKFKLNAFSLVDTAEIFFMDQSVNPTYRQNLAINKLIAGPFDNDVPEKETVITIVGKSDLYASFSLVTKAKPFLEKPIYKIEGGFKEFSLPRLSPYIKQALQYEIESGQLDLDIDIQLTGTKIDGKAQVVLRGIELDVMDDLEVSGLNDQFSVPLNIALGILKNSDGNVDLRLPITGDTRSPNFGLSGLLTLLVKKATILAAREYLVTSFVPYAQVVNIVTLAGSYALKVRIKDLFYLSGISSLQPEQQEFLKQFSALLKDNERTQVKLCAIATAADINKDLGSDLSDPKDIKRLKEISAQRVSIFKSYMIEEENISSSRLLLCAPKIDSSMGALPRINFKT
jgi:hypothetical protein